jgi:hypothetical protein
MKKLELFRKMKEERIYNVFSEKNQSFIIKKSVKKKGAGWCKSVKEEETNEYNLINDWKNKEKKPPDKIVYLEFNSIKKVQEYVEIYNGRKKKRRRKYEDGKRLKNGSKNNLVTSNINNQAFNEAELALEKQNGKIKVSLNMKKNGLNSLCEFRSSNVNCQFNCVELEVDSFKKTLLVTDSERSFDFRNIIIGDGKSLVGKYGYNLIKRKNNQEVCSDRENHRVTILASAFMRKESSEAVEETRSRKFGSIESVQRNQLIAGNEHKNGVRLIEDKYIMKGIFYSYEGKQLITRNFNELKETIKIGMVIIVENGTMLLASCIFERDSVYDILDICSDLLFNLVMVFGTESERKIRCYRIFRGDDEDFEGGYGYIYFKKANSQEVHQRRRMHRVVFCINNLSVKEGDSEAGAITRQEKHESGIMVVVFL